MKTDDAIAMDILESKEGNNTRTPRGQSVVHHKIPQKKQFISYAASKL